MGFCPIVTENQLNEFNILYKDYDFKLNDSKIDYKKIFKDNA